MTVDILEFEIDCGHRLRLRAIALALRGPALQSGIAERLRIYFVVGYFNSFQRVMPPATETTDGKPACMRIPAAVCDLPPDLQIQIIWRSR